MIEKALALMITFIFIQSWTMSWQHRFALTLENRVRNNGLNINFLLIIPLRIIVVKNRPHSKICFATKPIREHQLGEAMPNRVRHNTIVMKKSTHFVHSLLNFMVGRIVVCLVKVDIGIQLWVKRKNRNFVAQYLLRIKRRMMLITSLDGDVHRVIGVSIRNGGKAWAHAVNGGLLVDDCVAFRVAGAPAIMIVRIMCLLSCVSTRNQPFNSHISRIIFRGGARLINCLSVLAHCLELKWRFFHQSCVMVVYVTLHRNPI